MVITKVNHGCLIPVGVASGGGLLNRAGEVSVGCFFSAVRTEDKAATAAALWDPWLTPTGLETEVAFVDEDELNAEFKAAKADALWVRPPPWFVPFDLAWF